MLLKFPLNGLCKASFMDKYIVRVFDREQNVNNLTIYTFQYPYKYLQVTQNILVCLKLKKFLETRLNYILVVIMYIVTYNKILEYNILA